MSDDTLLPVYEDHADWGAVQAELWQRGLGDGLPLAPPTHARLEAMLAGVRESERSYGSLMPMYGELTPASVAYQSVLAGCEPAHLPVVLTALVACLTDSFNLLGIATTTGTPAVAVIVHGPVADRLGLNSGTNCLGPGTPGNAAIGRAVSLALRNIGGAVPGVGDMATMGQPGKYGFCFAESRAGLLPSLPARRGLGRDVDAVTVLGVSGTAEVLPNGLDTPEDILRPLVGAMWAARMASGGMREREPREQLFLLPPELATGVAGRGWSLADIQSFLATAEPFGRGDHSNRLAGEPAANPGDIHPGDIHPADVHPVVTGGPGIKMTHLPLWAGGTRTVTLPLLDIGHQ